MKLIKLILLIALASCSENDPDFGQGQGRVSGDQDWLIPIAEVFDVLGRDGIPSLSNPPLLEANQAGFLFDAELVIGYYNGTKPNFMAINEGKAVLADDEGNKWDIFGFPVSGALQLPLQSTQSFMGYWFAWGAFYPVPEIHGL